MSVGSPFAQIYGLIVDVVEYVVGKFHALCYNFRAQEVLHSLRSMVGSEHEQLLEQNLLECKLALVVLCVEVDKLLVGTLAALLLHCTGKEVGTDNHTLE